MQIFGVRFFRAEVLVRVERRAFCGHLTVRWSARLRRAAFPRRRPSSSRLSVHGTSRTFERKAAKAAKPRYSQGCPKSDMRNACGLYLAFDEQEPPQPIQGAGRDPLHDIPVVRSAHDANKRRLQNLIQA